MLYKGRINGLGVKPKVPSSTFIILINKSFSCYVNLKTYSQVKRIMCQITTASHFHLHIVHFQQLPSSGQSCSLCTSPTLHPHSWIKSQSQHQYESQHHVQLNIDTVTYRNIYTHIYIYICQLVYIFISLFCQLRGPRINDTSVATSTPRSHILVSNMAL